MPKPGKVDAFILRWEKASGTERANYQLFLTELCKLLDLPQPDPARDDTRDNAYVFERRVVFQHGDGSESSGFIDLYHRGSFVLEAKKVRKGKGKEFDDAMLRARGQAEQYARALPAAEGRPPFVVVADVGNALELYAEFTRSGATYTPYPDPQSHRVRLADLRDEAVRDRLKQVWLEPMALDPSRRSAKATREIAGQLAAIAYALERAGHSPDVVAGFLTRCLFSMFAEDVGLLPKRAFVELLERYREDAGTLGRMLGALWQEMDSGGFSAAIAADVLRFNGKIFKDHTVLPLDRDQIDLLLQAARSNWREVEPAIFGTLFERALNPEERHKLGAHYTPRAYVERLVLPTIVEPLREDWKNAQGAALLLAGESKVDEAIKTLRLYHKNLCEVRVLDPACGSGNFLYVTLEHLKRLEGEVLNQLAALGDTQQRIEGAGVTVDPHQLLGIEINPRAAAITELVLWIGYLQWHFRTRGQVMPPQPVLKDFRNIECRDALLAWDRIEYVTDERGVPVTRWNGKTYKTSPITGEDVPDETAQVPVEKYINPRKTDWPKADFVMGNPPFIGNKRMRLMLGDGYVETLRLCNSEVSDAADIVMYWWNHAAELVGAGSVRQFGFITTNSIRQSFNRRVVEHHLVDDKLPVSLRFSIADHPWVDSADGAAVRIAMTVAGAGKHEGSLLEVTNESPTAEGESNVELAKSYGFISSDLRIGANVGSAAALAANSGLALRGITLVGTGFVLEKSEVEAHRRADDNKLPEVVKRFFNGRDLLQVSRDAYVIDFFGMTEEQARDKHPALFQRILDRVKPERDQNQRMSYRQKWWIFAEPRSEFRVATRGLEWFIATPMTAKHRLFLPLDAAGLPDQGLVPIASSDWFCLGVLSSRLHQIWALASGGTLEDRPRYNQSRCFDTFPFPEVENSRRSVISHIAEQLASHRQRQLKLFTSLALTDIYNVLEKIRSDTPLSAQDSAIHEQGLISILRKHHDDLDRAVFDAYGWNDLADKLVGMPGATTPIQDKAPGQAQAEEALLARLVALNTERAEEEEKGHVHWLRPEFQAVAAKPAQAEIEMPEAAVVAGKSIKARRLPWPKELPDQVRAVANVLASKRRVFDANGIAACFTGKGSWKKPLQKRLPQLLETLEAVGRARKVKGGWIAAV
jgi:hypothetical protein